MMIKLAVVLMAVLAVTQATTQCDDLTMLKVQNEWVKAYGSGLLREKFVETVFKRFFKLAPGSSDTLKPVGSADLSSGEFRAFSLTVGSHIDNAISLLDNPEALNVILGQLNTLHTGLKAPDALVDVFMDAIRDVVPVQLGKDWDQDAWKVCFKIIAEGIKGEPDHTEL